MNAKLTSILLTAVVMVMSTASNAATLSSVDTFSNNSVNRSFWGVDRGDQGHILTQINGRLEYTTSLAVEGFKERPWIGSTARYSESWDVSVGVNIAAVPLSRSQENDLRIGLSISDGSNLNFADVELRLFSNDGKITRQFTWGTEGTVENGSAVATIYLDGTVRANFNANNKLLTFYFREGQEVPSNPWSLLGNVDLDAPGSNWGLNNTSTFRIGIFGESSGVRVNSGEVYADNFSLVTGSSTGTPPAITVQPQSQTVPAGSSVTFAVTATGTDPMQYQWRLNGANLTGATSSSLTFNNAQTPNAGSYSVVVSNAVGSATSASAVLTVNLPVLPPAIIIQPQNQTVTAGANVTFSVVATGTAPLSYQWGFNGANLTRATNSSLTVNNAQTANAGSYTVVVNNASGAMTSANAVLTVNLPASAPTITTQPQSQTVTASGSVTFAVTATGTAPLQYQWRRDGMAIRGAVNASYTVSNVQASQAGAYNVVVSNAGGSVTSASAVLTVNVTLAAPAISYTLSAKNLVLSWPTNWILQSTAKISAPTSWSNVSASPVVSNGQSTLTLGILEGNQFFRLIKP